MITLLIPYPLAEGQRHLLKAFLGKTNFLKPMISSSYIFRKHEKASKVA